MNTRALTSAAVLACAIGATPCHGQYFYDSKVDLRFNHLYDYTEMSAKLHELAEAYPDLLTIQSIGQSEGGRDLWLLTLNNPAT